MISFFKNVERFSITLIVAALLVGAATSPATANEDWDVHVRYFCGGAVNGNWDDIARYAANEASTPIEYAFANVTCELSRGNSDQYLGNMLHASIRHSQQSRNVMVSLVRHLLKDNDTQDNRQVFISLVQGKGVDYNLFHQIRSTWRNNNGRRDIAMSAARAICMSIDRYDIAELADIRSNECNTPPFVEPWRLP